MKLEYPSIYFNNSVSMDDVVNVIGLINHNIAEEPEILSLEKEWGLLGRTCLEYRRSYKEDIIPASLQKEIKETTHHILLTSSLIEKLELLQLKHICNMAPEASEFLIMYPEKFVSFSNEAGFIAKHLPKDTLKEPKISISGKCMTGQPVLDIVPQAQKFNDEKIKITLGGLAGSAEKMLSEMNKISEPGKSIFTKFILNSQEELQKSQVKAYQPIFN